MKNDISLILNLFNDLIANNKNRGNNDRYNPLNENVQVVKIKTSLEVV